MSSARPRNNLSKKNRRKTAKNSELSPEQSSSDEPTVPPSKSFATRPPPGVATKKVRTSTENDMEEDFAVVPPITSPTAPAGPSEASSTSSPPLQNVAAGGSTNASESNRIKAPENVSQHSQKKKNGPSYEAATPDGSTPNPAPADKPQANKVPPTGDTISPAGDTNASDTMDTASDPSSSDDGIAKFYAATDISDVIREGESKAQLLNRLKFYFTSAYPSTFKAAFPKNIENDVTLIVACFKTDSSEFRCLLKDRHDDLKKDEDSVPPVFHIHDPAAIKEDELLRSVRVSDIPLFLFVGNLKASFSRHGTIQKIHLYTPCGSLFQSAIITFTDPQFTDRWKQCWVSWAKCQCLRVVPASFSKTQRDARFAHTAVLRNLPANLDAMDLHNIYSDANAAAIGLPRNLKSYNNKPWAYFSFRSEEAMNAAMEMTFHLRNRTLVWCPLDEVKNLCSRCSSPAHSAKNCDSFNNSRGRSIIPKSLVDTYEKFKPAGFKLLVRESGPKRSRSSSRSRSRSKSRSRSRRRRNKNNQPNEHVTSPVNTETPDPT